MQTHTINPSTAPGSTGAKGATRRVVDAPMRMFHWLFALSFVGAYLSAESEHWRLLHITLGYTMAGLLAFRLAYGLFGPKPFRLAVLWRKLTATPAWLRSLASNASPLPVNWRQGQNLVMAALVATMLGLVLPITLSGYAIYNDWGGDFWIDALGELHEFAGELFLMVVLAHVALITGLSILRRSNMAQPMVTGRSPGKGSDLVPVNRTVLAIALLLAVIAFGAWQWQQAPHGLIPAAGFSASTLLQDDEDSD
jgi:cytochrome b